MCININDINYDKKFYGFYSYNINKLLYVLMLMDAFCVKYYKNPIKIINNMV